MKNSNGKLPGNAGQIVKGKKMVQISQICQICKSWTIKGR